MNELMQTLQNAGPLFWATLIPLVLFVWFLPVILAAFLNRPHLKYIAIAAIPAGLSFIAWGALIVWACSGKVSGRFAQWFEQKQQGRS
jgi:hypothetical protein